jgi:hypothetical protein
MHEGTFREIMGIEGTSMNVMDCEGVLLDNRLAGSGRT